MMTMLIQKDLDEIEEMTRNIVKDEVKHLPSKDEFFERMDNLSGEIKTIREIFEIHSGQHIRVNDEFENHEKGIRKVERRLNISPAAAS